MAALVKPVLKEYQPMSDFQKELSNYETQIRRRRIWSTLTLGFIMIPYYPVAFFLAGLASMSIGNFVFYGHEDDFRDKMDWLWHDRVKKIATWGGLTI